MRAVRPAAVRVPCSTSNLGSGFDVLGLALSLYLEARFTPGEGSGDEALSLVRVGTLEGMADPPGEDLALQAFRAVAQEHGWSPSGVVRLESEIPLARGLGSSAAALVAGNALARAALGLPPDPEAAFLHAAGVEGHGDNAAPCALGGFRAVVRTEEGLRALELALAPEVGVAYAAPAAGISTREARSVLPKEIPHGAAVRELGRLTALLRGLAEADAELVRAGVQDELHVPWRLPLIPGALNAIAAGYDAGAWGITISGAGSGLVALSARDDAARVAEAMGAVLAPEGGAAGGVALALEPDVQGLRVLTP